MKIYHVPESRSVRPLWLCYELSLEVEVEQIDFSPTFRDSPEWRAISPVGKVPALVDGDLHMFESGAMVNYILERYGDGRLQPARGTAESAVFHQWCWFAEATLIRPVGLHRILREQTSPGADLIADAKHKLAEGLQAVEAHLADRTHLLGDAFTAADIMMGYSVALVEDLLGDRYPNVSRYLALVSSRPAFQRVRELS